MSSRSRTRGSTKTFLTAVRLEIVERHLDPAPVLQRREVLDEELRLQGLGVIEVELGSLVQREVGAIAVVRVVLHHRHAIDWQRRSDRLRYRGLAGTRTPRDADDQGAHLGAA
jgi:hypothetical protein